ncbi:MAG: hypothetical protein L0I24_01100 [Pseudonocardia sp.]|nr:hypothetical protein [Pseudonocardia sp.]
MSAPTIAATAAVIAEAVRDYQNRPAGVLFTLTTNIAAYLVDEESWDGLSVAPHVPAVVLVSALARVPAAGDVGADVVLGECVSMRALFRAGRESCAAEDAAPLVGGSPGGVR